MDARHLVEQAGAIPAGQGREEIEAHVPPHRAKHGADILRPHPAATEGNGLIQQTEAIAHAAIRRPRQQDQGRVLEGHPLEGQDVGELGANLLWHQALEVELETA